MNIELKPIAESKVRQLGGEVCGVLVRKDEKLAAVDEHGRVMWLDSWGEAGRAQGGQGAGVVAWEALALGGNRLFHDKAEAETSAEVYGGGARPLVYGDTQPQPAQQGSVPHWKELEALADEYVEGYEFRGDEGDYQPTEQERFLIQDCVAGLMDEVHQMLKRAAPQQGSLPKGENDLGLDARYFHEKLSLILRDINSYTPTEMARALGRLAITANPETMREPEFSIRDLIDDPKYRDTQPQPAVPEGWKLVPVEPTEAMMRDAADNLCGQFGVEFVRPKEQFARAVYRELLRFAPATPTTPQADGWVRCDERLPTEEDCWVWIYDSEDSDIFHALWRDLKGDYENGHMNLSHWMPTGLKRPQPPKDDA